MSEPHQLSRADARRIAVRAQALTEPRPRDLLDVLRHVSLLQLSTTMAIAPSADLVAWSRIGARYDPAELKDALDSLDLLEFRGTVRLPEDLAPHRAEMAAWPGPEGLDWQRANSQWVADNDAARLDILEALRCDGPLSLRELPDTCARPWRSSGWNNNKSTQILVQFMIQRGEVAVAGRRGRTRVFDLAERIYPEQELMPLEQARALLHRRRLGALGIARETGPTCEAEPLGVQEAGEVAVVAGLPGQWRVDPGQLGQPFSGRTALLSPLDRLLHDRKRMAELFNFDYILEMYKPANERKWGYWAMPILHGDRLVGKLDATADRRAGVLRVNALHWDLTPTAAVRDGVDAELSDLAAWLELDLVHRRV